jgi:hypothetical protein
MRIAAWKDTSKPSIKSELHHVAFELVSVKYKESKLEGNCYYQRLERRIQTNLSKYCHPYIPHYYSSLTAK